MLELLLFVLFFSIGTLVAYKFSPATKVKKRMREALSPFEDLDAETRGLRQSLKNEIDLLLTQYIQGIQAARLKAISLDELKRHATGMRLQALKDIGIRSVADLQGWNEYRISQIRGVGPKSASAIVQAVATITAAAKAVPIDHPAIPFSGDAERQLIQALYRERYVDTHISEQGNTFATILTSHQCTRDAIAAKITLGSWLWKFGANETIRRSLDQANAIIGALEEQSFRSVRETLSISLNDCRAVCANRVPIELILRDFNENREFYDTYLTSRLGKPNTTHLASPTHKQAASEVVHVEFGHVVPGPPPRPLGASRDDSASASTQTQQSERLVSIGISSTIGQKPTEFALPAAPHSTQSKDLRWLMKGDGLEIQGHNLSYGFVYVGKGTTSEQHYVLNPWLPAKHGDATPSDVAGYYSSYSALSPEQRSRYLDWLAAGASPTAESGFGMLYFYGIERRMLDLVQGRVTSPRQDELEQLIQEVHRLGDLFKKSPGSVTACCQRLSDFVAARAFDGTSVPELPKAWSRTYELPLLIRYGLGCFMRDRRPIPVEWALRWAYVEPTIFLRTPATRCPQEFETAFATVYQDKFGDGLIVPANKTRLKLVYQPGWPMHPEPQIKHEFPNLSDIAAVSGPQQTLKTLVEQSTAMIDGYSRYLGRNTTKAGTLEARLNLPLRFWPSAERDRWQVFLLSRVDPLEPRTFESLLRELEYVGDPALAKATEIVANLDRALVGFEPDVLARGHRPKSSEMIVLFRLTSGSNTDRTTGEYKKASLTVSLSACVALADGYASEEESMAVDEMIASWRHLHVDLRTRLRAQYRLQVRQGISLASFKSRFSTLTSDSRIQLALALSSLATVDGNIAAAEVKLLEQVYHALELEPQLLYSHLYGGSQRAHPLESSAPSTSSGTYDNAVHAARLAALRRETEQVSALLAGVFAEEETPNAVQTQPPNPAQFPEAHPQEQSLPGLDSQHQRFLAKLLERPSWDRSELKSMAAKMQIMLDGALERINEASFDLIGEPLTEGDDPVYVQQNILENAE